SRRRLWDLVRELVGDGTAVLLTTQYLEADELADRIVVLNGGRVAARGTPPSLKAGIGGAWVAIKVAVAAALDRAARAMLPFADGPPAPDREAMQVTASIRQGTRLVELVRALAAAGLES